MTPALRRIYELLSPPEVAMLMMLYPDFTMPLGVQHGAAKMRTARQIYKRGGSDVMDVMPFERRYRIEDVLYENYYLDTAPRTCHKEISDESKP